MDARVRVKKQRGRSEARETQFARETKLISTLKLFSFSSWLSAERGKPGARFSVTIVTAYLIKKKENTLGFVASAWRGIPWDPVLLLRSGKINIVRLDIRRRSPRLVQKLIRRTLPSGTSLVVSLASAVESVGEKMRDILHEGRSWVVRDLLSCNSHTLLLKEKFFITYCCD